MTDQERKAMQMALDALQVMKAGQHAEEKAYMDKVIEALRQALAQTEQEPVAWMYVNEDGEVGGIEYGVPTVKAPYITLLYTAPPSKQEPVAWVKEGKVRVGFGRIEERKYVQFDQTLPVGTKLFAAPVSKQEWVSLTDEKIEHEWVKWKASVPRYYGFAKGIEAALKEKNT